MKKRIRVFSHGILAASDHHESPWEDLHYAWKERPGRRRRMSGFCVESLDECEAEIAVADKLVAQGIALDEWDMVEREALARLRAGEDVAVNSWDHTFPTVTVAWPLNRAGAERAMTWALQTHHGLRGPFKFDWNRPKHFVWPTPTRALCP